MIGEVIGSIVVITATFFAVKWYIFHGIEQTA